MSLLLPFAPSLLIILVMLLFGPVLINLLTKFISSRIEAMKLQMMVTNNYNLWDWRLQTSITN